MKNNSKFSSAMKSLGEWIQRGWAKVKSWFETSQPIVAAPVVAEASKEKSKPVPRIAPYERGIYVQCASCGVLHRLEAVCHLCGEPLCDDTQHCRLRVEHRHLERLVVVCPTCRPKALSSGTVLPS